MATLEEIDEAVEAVREYANTPLIILHCTSAYPTPLHEADIRTIPMLLERYQIPVGLSDHTTGIVAPVTAVALGAGFIEKHFTLDRNDGSVDGAFSLQPEEFTEMATACRAAWQALGRVRTGPSDKEISQRCYRRSLYAVKDIPAGGKLTFDNVRSIRPGYGLHPRELPHIIGLRAREDIPKGTPLSMELLESHAVEAR
jgi:sialic acid synthase SpsE